MGWSNNTWYNVVADQMGIDYIPDEYARTLTPNVTETTQLTAHLKGLDLALKAITDRLTAHGI